MAKLRRGAEVLLQGNSFYQRKWGSLGFDPKLLETWDQFRQFPFTTKIELSADQSDHPPFGTNLSYPLDSYPRLHQTSGTTTGRSLRWLDTLESWSSLTRCWRTTFELMGLTRADRIFFAFSFGPFLGFWTAFDAAAQAGMLTLPGGGMTTTARLRSLLEHRATVVCCTPTYAVHMADVAEAERLDLASSSVQAIVVAGEPGGNIPATRQRIESAWGARVFDHYGMTEVGPVASESVEEPGSLLVLEDEYIAEVLEPGSDREVPLGELGELVLTNLGRWGSPLIRYRTGDVVVAQRQPNGTGMGFLRLEGGVRGRTDDMIHIRGNNLYPSAIEAVVRRFPDVAEYRILVDRSGPMPDLRIEVEPKPERSANRVVETVSRAIRDELLFRVDVVAVSPGSLPRYEFKAKRVSWR